MILVFLPESLSCFDLANDFDDKSAGILSEAIKVKALSTHLYLLVPQGGLGNIYIYFFALGNDCIEISWPQQESI